MVQISGAFVSDRGARERNEDQAAWQPTGDGDYIALVADGMGGGADGDLFSSRTVSRMMSFLLGADHDLPEQSLFDAVEGTAADILAQRLEKEEYALSGSTLCAALIRPAADSVQVWFAWIGDSRIYQVDRNGTIKLLTEDHVYSRQLREDGMSQAEAEAHSEAARLTSSLGDQLTLEPRERFFSQTSLNPGDRLLLCSDGVSKVLDKNRADLAKLVSSGTSEQAAHALVTSALERGSRDNVTAMVVVAALTRRTPGLQLISLVIGSIVVLVVIGSLLLSNPRLFTPAVPTSPPVTNLATTKVTDTAVPTNDPMLGVSTSTAAASMTPVPTSTPTNTSTPTPTNTPRAVTRTSTTPSTSIIPNQATPAETIEPTPMPSSTPVPTATTAVTGITLTTITAGPSPTLNPAELGPLPTLNPEPGPSPTLNPEFGPSPTPKL